MACKQSIPDILGCKLTLVGRRVRARSLAAALGLGAGVALSLVAAPVPSATAQGLKWATSAGGDSTDQGIGIATDPRGNSYLTGSFFHTATFGAGETNETVLEADPSALLGSVSAVFVAKYARDGTLRWATSAGSAGADFGFAGGADIATNAHGESYVTGFVGGTATFGAGESNESVIEAVTSHYDDVFVAKYARDGTLLWATSAGGTTTDVGTGVAVDPSGNCYVTGFFTGTATFGAGEVNETVLETGTDDEFVTNVFVAKYARGGTLIWATSAGVSSGLGISGLDIATDPRGNSYVTGPFQDMARFGAGEVNETMLEAVDRNDVFVAEYAPDGTLLWATSAGGAGAEVGYGIATDPAGNSYVTGVFTGTATFGVGEANETVLETGIDDEIWTQTVHNVFVAKFATDGTLLWATSVGGISARSETGDLSLENVGRAIAIDPSSNSYVTGSFGGTSTFGAGEANETVLEAGARADAFVAKYAPDGTLLWATSAGSAGSADPAGDGLGIATDPRGNSYVTGSFEGTAAFGAGGAKETTLEAAGGSDVFVAKYGARDDQDQCPDPDPSPTVVLDGNDTGVENVLTHTEGCTILDLILRASDDAADRTEFIRGVALLTRTLLRDGLITAKEAGILRTAASQATLPLS